MRYLVMIVDENGNDIRIVAAADDEAMIKVKLDKLYIDRIVNSKEYRDKKLALYEIKPDAENKTSERKLIWISNYNL